MTEAEKAALRERVLKERGYWAPFHADLLDHAPDFLEAYLAFHGGPARAGLPAKLCELVYVAIDIAVSHLYEGGARRHMLGALDAGASPEEVRQTILIATAVAARSSVDLGISLLVEERPELLQAGPDDAPPPTEGGDILRANFPELADGYLAYGRHALESGPLSAKERQLIVLAVCAAPSCLHAAGIRQRIKGALEAGADSTEVMAVLHLAAAISIHSCTIGLPALKQVLEAR